MYPSFNEIRAKRISERRRSAIAVLREAEKIARSAGGRLMVFGSLAECGFDESSDIDIALFGIPADDDIFIGSRIETLISLRGFVVDLIEERFIPPSLMERIRISGKGPDDLAE